MLSQYPTYFNTTQILNPTSWNEKFDAVRNVAQTEGGMDDVTLIRTRKYSVSATYHVTDKWARIFEKFSWLHEFTLKRYDVYDRAYEELTVRMEDLQINRLKGSETIAVSNGLYEVSFNLVQF